MVAFVSGASQGLSLSSLATLGQHGLLGSAAQGRSGEAAFVNVASGNLTLQASDERLIGSGLAANTLRTYNSQGSFSGDNWAQGVELKRVQRVGTLGQPGSQLLRTDEDGAVATYAFDAATGLYRSTEGAGAHDTLGYDTAADQYVWTDGSSGRTERYSSAGRLESTSDASGNTLSYAYHADGRLQSVSTAGGETTTFVYDGALLVELRTTYQEEGATRQLTRTRYGYDAQQRLQTVTVDLSPEDGSVADGKVYVTTYTYDGSSNRVASVAQTDGTALQLEYVQVGGGEYRIWRVTDALNHLTEFSYDLANRRTAVTDPMGAVTVYEYGPRGELLRVTAPAVNAVAAVTSFGYSSDGDLTQVTDAEGRSIVMGYDGNGNQISQRDSAGNTITRVYNAQNHLLAETTYLVPDPDGAGAAKPLQPLTQRFVYAAANPHQLRFELSAEGRVTEHRYNTLGERVASIQYTGATYSVAGLATTDAPTEAQLNAWTGVQDRIRTVRVDMGYDFRGQLKTSTTYQAVDAAGEGVRDGSQSVAHHVYSQAGELLSIVSLPGGATTTYAYDGLGRVVATTVTATAEALSRTTVNVHDDANGRSTVTLANGLSTTSTYDRAGRLVSVLQSAPGASNLGESRYFYDAANRLVMTQDPTGARQWMLYDAVGRKVVDVDADGSLTQYFYNRNGQLSSTIAYASQVNTAVLVDGEGRPTTPDLSLIVPAVATGAQRSWQAYDAAGRLVKSVDALGYVTELTYDGASRVVAQRRYAKAIDTTALGTQPSSSA
ncbi:RHS repeat protein, partial [Methylibium rhizosphaerae]|uniref:RHS repeat protein n=1 Tax=Methylibium rhizosphaerae TaxID=2570323 RepID=UPI00112E7117